MDALAVSDDWLKRAEKATLVIATIIVVGVGGYLVTNIFYAVAADRQIQILTGLASTVLSLALIIIYYRMSRTQDALLAEQEQQRDIMREENSPQVSLDRITYVGWPEGFDITLSNLGKGSARNLEIDIEPELLEFTGEALEPSTDWGVSTTRAPLKRTSEGSELNIVQNSDYLKLRTTERTFRFSFQLEMYDAESRADIGPIEPSSALEAAIAEKTVDDDHAAAETFNRVRSRTDVLREEAYGGEDVYDVDRYQAVSEYIDFNRLRVTFSLVYTDSAGEEHTEFMETLLAPLAVDRDESELWERAIPESAYQLSVGNQPMMQELDTFKYNQQMDAL